MEQIDMFGDDGPMATDVRMPQMPADATRRSGHTCWKHCNHCDPQLLKSKSRVYRLCNRVGSKCYPASEVCEWVDWSDKTLAVAPASPGWDDY